MYTDSALTLDTESELGFAIGKASKYAKANDKMIWVYSLNGFLWMSEHYPADGLERVAECYPGGRNVLRRVRK